MSDVRHRTTEGLRLDAVTLDGVDEHFAILSDPGVWRHLPTNRHTTRERTADGIALQLECWQRAGLGVWTARLRSTGAVVGMGGCSVRAGTDWWNLYYRLTPSAWGQGLAAELVTASRQAAEEVRPELPVIAYLLEHNLESRRRAERSGLSLVWRGPDAGNPDPAAVRLVYADRPVDDDLVARVAALP